MNLKVLFHFLQFHCLSGRWCQGASKNQIHAFFWRVSSQAGIPEKQPESNENLDSKSTYDKTKIIFYHTAQFYLGTKRSNNSYVSSRQRVKAENSYAISNKVHSMQSEDKLSCFPKTTHKSRGYNLIVKLSKQFQLHPIVHMRSSILIIIDSCYLILIILTNKKYHYYFKMIFLWMKKVFQVKKHNVPNEKYLFFFKEKEF